MSYFLGGKERRYKRSELIFSGQVGKTGDRRGAGLCGERSNVQRDSAALYGAESG